MRSFVVMGTVTCFLVLLDACSADVGGAPESNAGDGDAGGSGGGQGTTGGANAAGASGRAGPVSTPITSGSDGGGGRAGASASAGDSGRAMALADGGGSIAADGSAGQNTAACAGLSAAGIWRNISPPNTDYQTTYTGINALAVRPDDPRIIYVGADSHGIYRSTDCGGTWAVVNTGRNAKMLSSGRPWSMAIDPVTPDVMYNVQGYGAAGLWKTANAGVDWDQVFSKAVLDAFPYGGQTDSISIDPTDHQHLVALPHGGSVVAESLDAGATWKLMSAPPWGENSSLVVLDKKTWLYCDFFSGLFRTSDEGASFQNVTPNGAGAVSCNCYTPSVYRSASGTFYLPTGNGVIQSADGITWSLIPNSGGRHTTLIGTGEHLIAGDQWSLNYFIADEKNPTLWKALPQPPGAPSGQGAAFMTYDRTHQILYSSNFDGGLWQMAVK
jgi:hypothetical protein